MKTILLTLLFITSITNVLLADQEVRDGVIFTSLIRVISSPEKYNGKRIMLKGFIRRGMEESGLYLSRDDAAILNTKQALWVGGRREGRDNIKFPEDGFVTIVGKLAYVKGRGFGHMGLWLAEIVEIEEIREISTER